MWQGNCARAGRQPHGVSHQLHDPDNTQHVQRTLLTPMGTACLWGSWHKCKGSRENTVPLPWFFFLSFYMVCHFALLGTSRAPPSAHNVRKICKTVIIIIIQNEPRNNTKMRNFVNSAPQNLVMWFFEIRPSGFTSIVVWSACTTHRLHDSL